MLTIITAVRDSAEALELTARSIRSAQAGPMIQWIVADGGSQDGFRQVIDGSEDVVSIWWSRQDSGIYDAWNQALECAQGKWILFLGAGDRLDLGHSFGQLVTLLRALPEESEIAYGKVLLCSPSGIPIETSGEPWSRLRGRWKWGLPMVPLHPGVLYRARTLAGRRPFDTSYRIAGDNRFLLERLLAIPPSFLDLTISSMPIGGVSARLDRSGDVHGEFVRIARELRLSPPLRHQIVAMATVSAKIVLHRFVSATMAHHLLDCVRRLSGKPPRWTVDGRS